jgi:two-component system phosphate regulon sensor histidine kinase PhoR
MKKKILTSAIITVIFSLLAVSTFFLILIDIEKMDNLKTDLEDFNDYYISLNTQDYKQIENYKMNGAYIRFTIINEEGTVLFDNQEENLGNHLDRPEIKAAIEDGQGYAVRDSTSTGKKMIYYATKMNDGRIIRSSITYENVKLLNYLNVGYGILVVLVVSLFSIALFSRIVKTITNPIKDLEQVTRKIADGDYSIRVNPSANDEIGKLGMTFNNMADQLQAKINEVLDKQNRLELILRCMESGVIAVNKQDEAMIINPYAKKIFGITEYLPGKQISDYIKDYDIITFLNEEDDAEKEIKILHPTEKELRIKKASILNGKTIIGKVIAVQDITDIKRLENMRSQFVANVSHELKTPLTSIKGFAETLKFVEDDETRTKFLDIINNEADRLTRLINDILVLSKIESRILGETEEFLPNVIVDDAVDMLKKLANDKNINLSVEQSNKLYLSGNKDKFNQLIINLVENGIKYSNPGASVEVKSYNSGNEYTLEVKDNGIGIPKDDIPRIFERFYRVDKSRKAGGTGLGLAIVKHIVKSFNGEIYIESEVGIGTKFVVKIKTE